MASGREARHAVQCRSLRLGLLGLVDPRPQITHGVAQRGELARGDRSRRLIGARLDLGERVLERGNLSIRRRQLILLRGDLPVRRREPLLGIERILGDQLLQVFDVALQAAGPPVHALLAGTELDARYVLRKGGRRCEWYGRQQNERRTSDLTPAHRRGRAPPSPFFRGRDGVGVR